MKFNILFLIRDPPLPHARKFNFTEIHWLVNDSNSSYRKRIFLSRDVKSFIIRRAVLAKFMRVRYDTIWKEKCKFSSTI